MRGQPVGQRFWVEGAGREGFLEIVEDRGGIRVRTGDREIPVDLSFREGSSFLHLLAGGRSYPCSFRVEGDAVVLSVRGRVYRFSVLPERVKRIRDLGIAPAGSSAGKNVVAPIPGLVVEIEVREGEEVVEGQGVVIMEAMKMENELRAPAAGIVREVLASKGKPVKQGEVLVVIE